MNSPRLGDAARLRSPRFLYLIQEPVARRSKTPLNGFPEHTFDYYPPDEHHRVFLTNLVLSFPDSLSSRDALLSAPASAAPSSASTSARSPSRPIRRR